MDKTKSKLAAFFDHDEEDGSIPHKPVDDQKLSNYAQGTVRKSRREKEKEAAEAKKKEEEEDAARAYAEFIETFEGEGVGNRGSGMSFVKASGGTPYSSAQKSQPEGISRGMRGFEQARIPSPPLPSAPKPKGKRAMDAFLEEIKRDQANREAKYSRHSQGRSVTALAAYEGQSGSKDRGDPETSNIFVANLPPHVTEQTLGTFFARIGPVGSVKIMWPRTDDTAGPGADMTTSRRSKSSSLSGFVSYMRRKDAEAALRELDGFDWGGSILRVGWSKAVPLAAKPMYTTGSDWVDKGGHGPRRYHSRSPYRHSRHSRSRSRSRSRSGNRSPPRYRRRSYSRGRRSSSRRGPSRSRSPPRQRLNAEEEIVTDTFIRAVAAEVKGHGEKYEEILQEREHGNSKYGFLLDKKHRRHAYYKGLINSAAALDPEFDDEGYNSVYSTDSAEESEKERCRKASLGRLARKRFEAMIRAMTGKRGELARCMVFGLDHAEAAAEVSEIIIASLLVDSTPVPRKVARLHLICDILHNSAASVPNAWKFRQEFQSRLGIVFDHLANIYHSFPGRITAETFKKQILSVVELWEDWIVFPPDFTSELRSRLEGSSQAHAEHRPCPTEEEVKEAVPEVHSKFKASSFQPANEPVDSVTLRTDDLQSIDRDPAGDPGVPSDDDVDGVSIEDIDGAPMDDSLDGAPILDIDGTPVDDVDGVPMDDIDGTALEDIDGVPMDGVDGETMEDR